MFTLFVSLRPRQWAKNLLVFAALVFGHQLLSRDSTLRALTAFSVFCLLSSAVYLVNDVMDREADRRHPLKASRPLASGALTVPRALTASVCLTVIGLAMAAYVSTLFGAVAAGYVLLMASYVFLLKHVAIVDTLVISIGFVLRAWGGAAAVQVPVSSWLLLLTLLLAMFLALSKRRAELATLADDAVAHRRALGNYSARLLDCTIGLVTALTVVAYALYTLDSETIARFGTNHLVWTLPFPIFGISRYLYLVYQGTGGSDPSEHLLSDLPLLACVVVWIIAVVRIIYGPLTLIA